MTSDGPTSSAPPPSSPNRWPARELLALMLGRDAVPASGAAGDGGPGPAAGTLLAPPLQLFVLSFLMLFVELALIRWSGALVIYLSYFSNFVLLGSFLGIGIGFLRARSRVNLFPYAPVALALLILFVRVFPVEVIRTGYQLLFFGYGKFNASGPPTWVTLPIVFLAVATVMEMIGEGVARTFIRFRPLDAYRLDIGGSIAGIVAFSALSFLDAKPVVWALIVATVMLLLYGRRVGLLQIVAVVALVMLLWSESLSSTDIWSPYYRISYTKAGDQYAVSVNGIPHQNIIPARKLQKVYSQPYLDDPGNSLNNVLIIGAGTGDDVANALLKGAKHIDAVEIDPELYQLGVRLNPDHPYQNPRVSVHINDGRAFLEQTHTKYDMILFALPDSLTLVAGQSSLRLESYLFTLQAVEAAKAHLNPGDGLFAMYNYYRTPWLRDRLANTLEVAFGHAPCADNEGFSLSMLSVTINPSVMHCNSIWQRPANVVPPATDDHPFVYLDGNSIPWLYRITLGLILLASIVLVRPAAGPYRRMTGFIDLFFMGAAFMLLETKNIVQFALLFGTTWFVNALVTAGVLVAVYAAVEVSRHVVIRRPALLYAGLLAALVVAWAVPPESLLSLLAGAPLRGGGDHRLRADLPGQHGLRPAVPRYRGHRHGLRRQPAWRDDRRDPGVHRARHRVPVAARPGGAALRAGVHHRTVAPADRCRHGRADPAAGRPVPLRHHQPVSGPAVHLGFQSPSRRSNEVTWIRKAMAVGGLSHRYRPQRHDGVTSLRHRRVSLSDGGELTVRAHEEEDVVPGWQRAVGVLRGDPRAVVIPTADPRPGHALIEQDLPAGVGSDHPVAALRRREPVDAAINTVGQQHRSERVEVVLVRQQEHGRDLLEPRAAAGGCREQLTGCQVESGLPDLLSLLIQARPHQHV